MNSTPLESTFHKYSMYVLVYTSLPPSSRNLTATLHDPHLSGIIVCKIQRAMRVDGGEMGVSVHFMAGAWGLLAPGLLAAQPAYENSIAGEKRESSFDHVKDSNERDGTLVKTQEMSNYLIFTEHYLS